MHRLPMALFWLVLLPSCSRLGTSPILDSGTDGALARDEGTGDLQGDTEQLPGGRLSASPTRFDALELLVGQPREVSLVITRDDGLILPPLVFSSDADWISASFSPSTAGTSTSLTLRLDPTLAGRGRHAASGTIQAAAGGLTPVSVALDVLVLAEIYRSVEPGRTTPLAQGAGNTLTLTGQIAEFAQPLPAQMGLGDVIQYDSDGNEQPDALAFIQRRISATRYLVQSPSGGLPQALSGPTQSWSGFRAYTSLADAVTGKENAGLFALVRDFDQWSGGKDLLASNERWNLACYGGAPDTTCVGISSSWRTGAQTHLKLFTPVSAEEVGLSQRHHGAWSDTAYRLEVLTSCRSSILLIEADHVWVEGLQLRGIADDSSFRGIWARNNGPETRIRISDNLIRGEGRSSALTFSRAIQISLSASSSRFYIWNNIVFDLGSTNQDSLLVQETGATIVAYNNSFIHGRVRLDSPAVGLAKNTIALDGFLGTFLPGSSYNATAYHDRTAGSPSIVLASSNTQDFFLGEGDYRISPDAPLAVDLIDTGTDLGEDPDLAVLDDLVGTARPQGLGFDLGAHELTR